MRPALRWLLVLVGVALSIIDAAFSLSQAGRFSELNPLLAPLLRSPSSFLALKALLTIAGFVALGRLAAARVLSAALSAYVLVDSYWVWRVFLAHA